MDSKGEESSQSYPNLFFMIDTYDEVSIAPLFKNNFVTGLVDRVREMYCLSGLRNLFYRF